ncbi:MAG: 5-(carboxyamino)imidazole ribonucleotide mutase [Bacteroidia bacterium]|jgi:5-(carboxyamino)imidazole ribonucleotide mutase|nr:5-(carboxyamino)imidazole ribonucleotide mutase [Bacteroidia bacterium]
MYKVGIIMGSDSDLNVMNEAVAVLEELGVENETTIVSAHRTPDRLVTYAKEASNNGIHVIIAGAGGAAHLPGMVASMTHLPVIGVPVKSKTMSGIDSLYSIVQMPPGVPVATVAINGARNAGILAAQIIGVHDKATADAVMKFKSDMEEVVLNKAEKLEDMGSNAYLNQMP